MRALSFSFAALLAAGCGFLDAPGTPLVEAHRGGASEFPQESRSAIRNALEKGYAGIEFDLVLSKDQVPMLSHDAWVQQTYCTRADGTALPQDKAGRILVKDLTADELKTGFLCGGAAHDPQFPDAKLVAEPMLTLDDVIALVRDHPSTLVHLDIKYEPGLTLSPDLYAREILGRWRQAKLANPWYVSADLPEVVRAFEALSGEGPVETVYSWPRFPPDSESQQVEIVLGAELKTMLGLDDLVALAKDLHADGLAIPYQVAERRAFETARSEGLKIRLWTLDSEKLLDTYCSWPVDSLITDMPSKAPCR